MFFLWGFFCGFFVGVFFWGGGGSLIDYNSKQMKTMLFLQALGRGKLYPVCRMRATRFISHYLNGRLSYIRRHITANKMC